MDDRKVLNNIKERIALDNFKIESIRNKKNKKMILIVASAAVIIGTGVIAVNAMSKKD